MLTRLKMRERLTTAKLNVRDQSSGLSVPNKASYKLLKAAYTGSLLSRCFIETTGILRVSPVRNTEA